MGDNLCPAEVKLMMRVEPGKEEEADARVKGRRRLVRRNSPTWFVPKWVSIPSSVFS